MSVIASAFAKSTAPEVTFVSPCECIGFHGKNRWVTKTDLSSVPPDKSAIQSVTPSQIYAWEGPGPDVDLTSYTEARMPSEQKWYALTGRVVDAKSGSRRAFALFSNTTGSSNTAIGSRALQNNTGNHNIALGEAARISLTTGNDNIDIAQGGLPGETATIRIGGGNQTRTFIAGIRGITTGINDAIPVMIDSVGQLGTLSSSKRFKKEIQPMDKASEAILALTSRQQSLKPAGVGGLGLSR